MRFFLKKIDNFENLINYIKIYRNNEKKMLKIRRNFSKYIDLCDNNNFIFFINEIKDIPAMEDVVDYNSDIIYRKFGIKTILDITKKMEFKQRYSFINEMYELIRLSYYTLDEFLDDLIQNNETDYICNNLDIIIDSSNIDNLTDLGLLQKLKLINEEELKKAYPNIVRKLTGKKEEILDDNTVQALTMIFEEIAQNEMVDVSDVEYIGRGDYSNVYKLGNKVIKLGVMRLTNKIPYHRRILQPLLRRKIKNKDLYIEIAEYVERDTSITDEDAYSIYKELRDDGIIWLDAKKENVGRLKKNNIIHFKEPLYVEKESIGYIKEPLKEEEPLNKGDLVIIDTDYLFIEKDFHEDEIDSNINLDFYKANELRYQKEKNEELEDTIEK